MRTSVIFRVPRKTIVFALMTFFPLASFSIHNQRISKVSDETIDSTVLVSDTIPASIAIIRVNYNKLPSAGDDPLHHLEYTNYPTSQVRPVDFSALITNTDTVELTGVFLEVYIEEFGYSETFNSASITLNPGDTTMLIIPDYTPPLEQGYYDIQYTIHWDQADIEQLPTELRSFRINEGDVFIYTGNSTGFYPDEFSRDNGELIASTDDMGTGDTFKAGLVYSFTEETEICCIGLEYAPESGTGHIKFELIQLNEPYDEFESIQTYVDLSPFGNTIHWAQLTDEDPFSGEPYPTSVAVDPGDKYLVLVEVLNHEEDTVQIGISSNAAADSSAFVYGEFDDLDCSEGCPTNDMYMIRLGLIGPLFDVNVTELTDLVSGFYCAPNPVNGPLSVHYTLLEKAEVEFYLFDNMGRIVIQENQGTQIKGEHVFYSDTQSLADGVYTVSLVVNGKVTSEQLVIGTGNK